MRNLILQTRDPDPSVRDTTVKALGLRHNKYALQPLIDALNDTNLRVAQDAATALGQLRSVAAVQPLIDSLHHGYCSGIVSSNPKATGALIAIGMSAVPAMLDAISHSSYGVSGDISLELKPAFDGIQSPSIVPPLVALLKNPDYRVRSYALDLLTAHPGSATVEAALPMLHDPSEYVRGHAILVLGANLNDPRAVAALREAAEAPADKTRPIIDPRITVVRMLAKAHDPALIPIFIDATQLSDATTSDEPAAQGLLALGPVSIPPLIAALNDITRPPALRGTVAGILGQFDDPRVIQPLLAVARDPSKSIRKGVFGSKIATTSPAFTDLQLAALRNDTWWRIRQLAALALADHDDHRVTGALIAALKDPDENVRAAAASSLGKRHATEAVEPLIAYMRGPATLDQQQGAEALGAIGDARAIDPLIDMLSSRSALKGDCYPIGDALVALHKKFNDPNLIPHLRETLGNPNSARCGPALSLLANDPGSVKLLTSNFKETRRGPDTPLYEVLEGSHNPAAVEPAIAALTSDDALTRAHAAEVLGGLKDPRAIAPLLAALQDPDPAVQREAARALVQFDDPSEIASLAAALNTSADFYLRDCAAWSLGRIHDPRALAALIAALQYSNSNTHSSVVEALQHSTYAPVVPALLQALQSADPVVRAGAAEALRYRTDPGIAAALVPLQKDTDPAVQKAAAEALSGCPVPPVMD